MATMTMNVEAAPNSAPVNLGRVIVSTDHDTEYVFTTADFTTDAVQPFSSADPEGDALNSIRIDSLPSSGTLNNNGSSAVIGDVITAANLALGHLTYDPDPLDTAGYIANWNYNASDVGSTNFAAVSGLVTINVGAEINLPPTEVGDGQMVLDYGQVGVFTVAMFTTGTTPPYSDPEADPALFMKVLSLPVLGEIQLSGIPVSINQEISMDDIDDGLLTYVPDLADTDGDLQGFTFALADQSGIFVS